MPPRNMSRSYSRESDRRDPKRYSKPYEHGNDRYYGSDSRKRPHWDRDDRTQPRNRYEDSKRQERYSSTRYDNAPGRPNHEEPYVGGRKYSSGRHNISPEEDSRRRSHVRSDRHEADNRQIEVLVEEPDSELKVHFRFRPIKIDKQSKSYLIDALRGTISREIGEIYHFGEARNSRPGHLILELGLLKDSTAVKFAVGHYKSISVVLDNEKVSLVPEVSNAFDRLMTKKKDIAAEKEASLPPKAHVKEKKKESRREKRSVSSSSSNRSSRSYSSHSRRTRSPRKTNYQKRRNSTDRRRNSPDKRRNSPDKRKSSPKGYDKYPSRYSPPRTDQRRPQPYNKSDRYNQPHQSHDQNTHQISAIKVDEEVAVPETTLMLFGLHSSISSKEITNYLYNHKEGNFYSKSVQWRRVQGSNSEYLELKMPKSNAEKLMQLGSEMQVKNCPFIIIEGDSGSTQSSREYILSKIAKYQINILFPQAICPYYVLKGMGACGNVVQMTSNNRLNSNDQSEYYNVTFNDSRVCSKLRELKKTADGIVIESAQDMKSILVYRQNKETELFTF